MKVKFSLRFEMAWKAFWLIPFWYQIRPFHYHCELRKDMVHECDNMRRKSRCQNPGSVALVDTIAEFRISNGDRYENNVNRFKIAHAVFNLIPYGDYDKMLQFTVEEYDFYHLCTVCTNKYVGATDKEDWK